MLDKKMTMLEEVRDSLLQPLTLASGSFGLGRGRPTTLQSRLSRGQFFPDLGHRPQNRLGQFLEDVEFADLVRNIAEHCTQRLRIKRRCIGGNAPQSQVALRERF